MKVANLSARAAPPTTMTNGVLPALELVELQVGLLVAEPAALGAQLLLLLHLVQEGLGQ